MSDYLETNCRQICSQNDEKSHVFLKFFYGISDLWYIKKTKNYLIMFFLKIIMQATLKNGGKEFIIKYLIGPNGDFLIHFESNLHNDF